MKIVETGKIVHNKFIKWRICFTIRLNIHLKYDIMTETNGSWDHIKYLFNGSCHRLFDLKESFEYLPRTKNSLESPMIFV